MDPKKICSFFSLYLPLSLSLSPSFFLSFSLSLFSLLSLSLLSPSLSLFPLTPPLSLALVFFFFLFFFHCVCLFFYFILPCSLPVFYISFLFLSKLSLIIITLFWSLRSTPYSLEWIRCFASSRKLEYWDHLLYVLFSLVACYFYRHSIISGNLSKFLICANGESVMYTNFTCTLFN